MKTIPRVCVALLGAVLALSSVQAQAALGEPPRASPPPIRFERLTPDDGLSQGTVEAFLQDSQGFS